jgi:hypothetical protein
MADVVQRSAKASTSYELFILVLTVISLGIMVLLMLPISDETTHLLTVYDNAICVVFLLDFGWRLKRTPAGSCVHRRPAGLAGSARFHPELRLLPVYGPVPPRQA